MQTYKSFKSEKDKKDKESVENTCLRCGVHTIQAKWLNKTVHVCIVGNCQMFGLYQVKTSLLSSIIENNSTI